MVRDSRIRRHHKVCDLVVAETQRFDWSVERERRWTGILGTVLVPDLICTKADLALDVTIRHKFEEDFLEKAWLEKVNKYRPLTSVLIRELPAIRRVQVFGLPMGERGKWPPFNGKCLKVLGLEQARHQSFAELVSHRTLLYSLDVLRDFMPDKWRKEQPPA